MASASACRFATTVPASRPISSTHIFEKFAQADATSSRQKGGTGLGLSIVKQIVERLGGEVGFEDAPDGGTIFYVALPAWKNAALREVDVEAPAGAPRILVCEDDRETAAALRERLRGAGFAADLAHTAADAVERALSSSYAAILVDLQLPDGDGIGLILRLRAQARYQRTPIIVISGDPSLGRNDARAPGLNVLGWLDKPVDFDHLAEVLAASIAAKPSARPRILHVDDDRDVLAVVAHALREMADVISVNSIDAARRALAAGHIDLAVLDVAMGTDSGLDLLPDLRDDRGVIPVIVFSARGGGLACGEQIQAALEKPHTSLESLAATVRNRLALVRPLAIRGGRMTALRILHVDDEPDIREVVEMSLDLDPDFVTRGCGSGSEALTVAGDWPPDIILLDVMMPVMDGPTHACKPARQCRERRVFRSSS